MSAANDVLIREPSIDECRDYAAMVASLAQQGTFSAIDVDFDKSQTVLVAWREDPNRWIRIASVDGQPAGAMIGHLSQQWFSQDWTGHDTVLFVAPQYRGLGIARRLAGEFETWCRERGAKLVFMASSTAIQTAAARHVCESLGLHEVGQVYAKEIHNV